MLLLSLLLMSCSKEQHTVTTPAHDSVQGAAHAPDSVTEKADTPVILPSEPGNSETKPFRYAAGDSIVQTINSAMIPLQLKEEFTNESQKYIIKIKNFDRQNISGEIQPEAPEMNIRFNQIRLPNGDLDGPFGRGMIFKIRETGDLWLIIGRSNMASGKTTGRFTVSIK